MQQISEPERWLKNRLIQRLLEKGTAIQSHHVNKDTNDAEHILDTFLVLATNDRGNSIERICDELKRTADISTNETHSDECDYFTNGRYPFPTD